MRMSTRLNTAALYLPCLALMLLMLPAVSSAQTIDIWKGQRIGHFNGYYFPVSIGKPDNPTPTGRYTVKKKQVDYVSFKYKLPMPYSVFFTDAHAIHSGDISTASRGCVRVPRPVAMWLYEHAKVGKTKVRVHP